MIIPQQVRVFSVRNEYIEDRSFIGGAADRKRLLSSEGVVICESGVSSRVRAAKHSVVGGKEGATSVGHDPDEHSTDVEHFNVGSWSLEGIQAEQRADPVIGKVIEFLEKDTEKPPWDQVALLSRDFKCLLMQWPRLAIRDGLLKRQFESVDGLSVCWQVVWPASHRSVFEFSPRWGNKWPFWS